MQRVGLFLRAVNLAGCRLTSADFKRALAAAGYPDALTLLATGNAVISAHSADTELEAAIAAGLESTLGQTTEVYARDGAELAAVMAANPFAAMTRDNPSHMLVVFLRGDPGAPEVQALRGRIKGREEVAPGPGCLYATYPDGIGESRLTAAMIERALSLRGTARNWNTVRRMAELISS